MSNSRKIKISRKYRYNKSNHQIPVISPKLVLQGEWLKQAGFSTTHSVMVEIHNQMLVITVK
jgi:Toxin SymE, type I toxin-antitoxin system